MASIIINCDDFGLDKETNKNISTLFQEGSISSCSCLVNFPDFDHAVELAKKFNFSDKIGLHFNITEGSPLSKAILNSARLCDGEVFVKSFRKNKVLNLGSYEVAMNFLSKEDLSMIKEEFHAQVEKFISSFGMLPSHVDSHHGSHHDAMLFVFICSWCSELSINAVRPQFNLKKTNFIIKLVKTTLNIYAKIRLKNQVDFFGDLEDIKNCDLATNASVELMVHALTNKKGEICDLDLSNLKKKILTVMSLDHHLTGYR